MGPEWVAILALVALFVIGTLMPINMGALAYVAAWLVGMYSLDLDEKTILAGISADLVLTLIGVTYLFAIARQNGTVDLIVRKAVGGVGGRVALIPWVMFAVTALITAIGAASPAACAIIGPIALGFAGRYKISPLMMGMMVVHGAQAGGFSPISIYGVITNSVMESAGLPSAELTIFFSSLIVNIILAAVLFVVLGGRDLMSMRLDPDADEVGEVEPSGPHAGPRHRDRSTEASGTGATPSTGTSTGTTDRGPPATTSAPAASTRSPCSRSSPSPPSRSTSRRTSASPPSPPRWRCRCCRRRPTRTPSSRSPGRPSSWSRA